jgi:formiminotetrahydrofolate cyclodeaminase
MSVKEMNVQDLLEALAGPSATPGGGSAAALAGAMGAALLSMACNLTIGRKRFAAVEDELRGVLQEAEHWRQALTGLADADARSFEEVMAAYRLPQETQEEQAARRAAIQAALRHATQVPLETTAGCAALVKLIGQVIAKINPNVMSDAVAGALLAMAGLKAAQLNVAVNLSAIEDLAFVQETQRNLNGLLAGVDQDQARILTYVLEHVS